MFFKVFLLRMMQKGWRPMVSYSNHYNDDTITIRSDQISHRSDTSPKFFENCSSPIFRFFDGFSRNIDLSTYINRFFSILAPRRLSMSQIRWLRPYFMTIFRFHKNPKNFRNRRHFLRYLIGSDRIPWEQAWGIPSKFDHDDEIPYDPIRSDISDFVADVRFF